MDNEVIRHLLDAHLSRGEKRAGATWYELAHDRLVQPIKESNTGWFERKLHPFQHCAALWVADGSPANGGVFLLSGRDLRAALAWQKGNPDLVTADEQEFLSISQTAR